MSGSAFDRTDTAALWRQTAARRNASFAAATERMLTVAGVGPGVRVLELGTGAGDVALFAAGRGANVVATDLSEAMLEAARQAAGDAGAANVEFRRMDASALEFGATEFDAVIARHVLMFLPDLPVALTRVRRVLRPGGKFAAIVWGPLAENPFQAALIETARTPPPTSEMVIAFSLSRERLESAMQRAGFQAISIEKVGGESRYPSLAEALRGEAAAAVPGPTSASATTALVASTATATKQVARLRMQPTLRLPCPRGQPRATTTGRIDGFARRSTKTVSPTGTSATTGREGSDQSNWSRFAGDCSTTNRSPRPSRRSARRLMRSQALRSASLMSGSRGFS